MYRLTLKILGSLALAIPLLFGFFYNSPVNLAFAASQPVQADCLPNGYNLHGFRCGGNLYGNRYNGMYMGYGMGGGYSMNGNYGGGGYASPSYGSNGVYAANCTYPVNSNYGTNGNNGGNNYASPTPSPDDSVESMYYAPDGDNDADDTLCKTTYNTSPTYHNGYTAPMYNYGYIRRPFYFNNRSLFFNRQFFFQHNGDMDRDDRRFFFNNRFFFRPNFNMMNPGFLYRMR